MRKLRKIRELDNLNRIFFHAEEIGQARLNNFLMTGTILLVGCSVSLTITPAIVGSLVSITLSLSGVLFCRTWYHLGSRQRKFHNYIQFCRDGILENIGSQKSHKHYDLEMIRHFQQGTKSKIGIEVTRDEKHFSSRTFLTVVPRYFAYAYIVILLISLASLFTFALVLSGWIMFICFSITSLILIMMFSCGKNNTFLFLHGQDDDKYEPNKEVIFELVRPVLEREGVL